MVSEAGESIIWYRGDMELSHCLGILYVVLLDSVGM
jgi:hypothetical protein